MSDRKAIASRFSRASGSYSTAADVQRDVVEELVARLPDSAPRRILEIGCGTGMLTARLLEKYLQAEMDAVDIAEGMIAFCRNRFAAENRIQWHVADILEYAFPCKYDLIASSSAIHWVPDLDALIERLRSALSGSGKLVFSLMLEHTFSELHEAKKRILSDDRIGHRLPSFEQVHLAVERTGLRVMEQQLYRRSVPYASAAEFFREINAQGVTSGRVSRTDTPLNRRELIKLAQTYDQMFGCEEGGVTATYECGLFVAE